MAKTTLQLRRGTQGENSTFTGALGEVVVDTTRKTLVVHDGATVGGSALATLDSPALTGNPTAPTQTSGNNSTRVATTAFVQNAISGFGAQPTSTDQLTEGTTNLYFSKDRVLSSLTAGGNISITQPGGPGTNVRISYTQPTNISAFTNDAGYLTNASIRTQVSASGSIAYDQGTGIFSYTEAVNSVNTKTGAVVLNSDDISDTGRTNKWASSSVVRGFLAAGTGLTYTSGSGTFALTNTSIQLGGKTISLTSGSNQAYTTDDLVEGSTNKYFSTTLARGAFSAGTGVTIVNGQVAIGQAVSTTSDVQFRNITATGDINFDSNTLRVNGTTNRVGINTASPAYDLDVTGNVNLTGRLSVNGNAGTDGFVLLSGGASASPTWANIANSLPEIVELDKIREVRTAQATWYGFIDGTTFTDPEDINGTLGIGTFTVGMDLFPSRYISNGIASSGSLSYNASISGTTMTVTSGPVLGSPVANTSFASGGTSGTNTIVMTSGATTIVNFVAGVTVTVAYSSGGAVGLRTATFASIAGLFVGAAFSSGTGLPAGTVITDINPITNVVSFSNAFTIQATGNYNFIVNGGAPGQTGFLVASLAGIFVGQVVTGTGIPTNTTVTAITGNLITISQPLQVQAAGAYNFQFNGLAGVQIGQVIVGTGIPAGTIITGINAGTLTVTLSSNLTTQAEGFYNYFAAVAPITAGMGVVAQNFVSGNLVAANTYVVTQLTSSATPTVQLSYSSGGASGSRTITFTNRDGVAVGQLVSGTGVPPGTFVVSMAGLSVTISQDLTTQASGTYNFFTAGSVGTYQINQSQTVSTMTMVSGVVTISLDPLTNNELDGTTPPYQPGQRINISNFVPSAYNGTYIVTGCTTSTVSVANTATGQLISAGYVEATMNGRCEITGVNKATFDCTVNGTSLTITNLISGTISVGQALFGPGIVNLYIVSGSGSSWTLNRSQGNLGSFTNISATSYTVFPAQSVLPTLISGFSKLKNGGTYAFAPTTNGSSVAVTYPVQLQIVKNGVQLVPWLNNSGSVWQNLTPYGDYTIDSNGNIVFSTPPQEADGYESKLLVGRSTNPVVKTYPFRAVDIMLGT